MPGALQYLHDADPLTRALSWLLLAMSLASWCCLLFKTWMLLRARLQLPRALAAFWAAADFDAALQSLEKRDGEKLAVPLARAAWAARGARPQSLAAGAAPGERVLRALRAALLKAQRRLEFGHVLLASIGASAPFVGLLGTVWGIYHTLIGFGGETAGRIGLAQITKPVGEALIMTAAGLAVAIPAVLAYNALSRMARNLGEELDGFAHDLHAQLSAAPDSSP